MHVLLHYSTLNEGVAQDLLSSCLWSVMTALCRMAYSEFTGCNAGEDVWLRTSVLWPRGMRFCAAEQRVLKCHLFEHPSLFAGACTACALYTCRPTSAIMPLAPSKDRVSQESSTWQAVLSVCCRDIIPLIQGRCSRLHAEHQAWLLWRNISCPIWLLRTEDAA